jgi:hypothetical protein
MFVIFIHHIIHIIKIKSIFHQSIHILTGMEISQKMIVDIHNPSQNIMPEVQILIYWGLVLSIVVLFLFQFLYFGFLSLFIYLYLNTIVFFGNTRVTCQQILNILQHLQKMDL